MSSATTRYKRKLLGGRLYFTCTYCGRDRHKAHASIDHIIPLSRGGEDARENMALVCIACNGLKGSDTYEEMKNVVDELARRGCANKLEMMIHLHLAKRSAAS